MDALGSRTAVLEIRGNHAHLGMQLLTVGVPSKKKVFHNHDSGNAGHTSGAVNRQGPLFVLLLLPNTMCCHKRDDMAIDAQWLPPGLFEICFARTYVVTAQCPNKV